MQRRNTKRRKTAAEDEQAGALALAIFIRRHLPHTAASNRFSAHSLSHSFRFIISHLVDTIPLLQWQSPLLSPFALSLCEQARVRPLLASLPLHPATQKNQKTFKQQQRLIRTPHARFECDTRRRVRKLNISCGKERRDGTMKGAAALRAYALVSCFCCVSCCSTCVCCSFCCCCTALMALRSGVCSGARMLCLRASLSHLLSAAESPFSCAIR